MKDKPRYTFGLKTEKAIYRKAKVPGPGTYKHKSNISKRPSSKFGRQKRDMTKKNRKRNDPGPNHYKPR